MSQSTPEGITLGKGSTLVSHSVSVEPMLDKPRLEQAWVQGKTIQSNHFGKGWVDYIRQNQLDKPNFKFGKLSNWRIKPE